MVDLRAFLYMLSVCVDYDWEGVVWYVWNVGDIWFLFVWGWDGLEMKTRWKDVATFQIKSRDRKILAQRLKFERILLQEAPQPRSYQQFNIDNFAPVILKISNQYSQTTYSGTVYYVANQP